LDVATAAQMLIKQVGMDTASATFLATAAVRAGYTAAAFAALIAPVRGRPESIGMVYQQLAPNLLLLESADSEPEDYLT
jgi:hypothetical protein